MLIQREIYFQTIWFIRRYWDLQDEYDSILNESGSGHGRGSGIGNPTAVKAERLDKLYDDINAIEKALKTIPEDYQKGILIHIIARKKYPNNANPKTYKKWQQRFIIQVAYNKHWI